MAARLTTAPPMSATATDAGVGHREQQLERGHLRQQHQHQGDHAERADVRALHHLTCLLGWTPAAESVGDIGEAIQVQTSRENSECCDTDHCTEERSVTELGDAESAMPRRVHPEHESHDWGERHAPDPRCARSTFVG